MSTTKKRQTYRERKTERNKRRFLEVFRECGNITQAAIMANVDRIFHYRWLASDPDYKRAFDDASEHACDLMLIEARKRAMGWDEPIVYAGEIQKEPDANGNMVPATIRRYDSTLLMFLIKGARPDVYRDTWKGEIEHKEPVRRDPDLAKFTLEELRAMKAIAEKAHARANSIGNGHSAIPDGLLTATQSDT